MISATISSIDVKDPISWSQKLFLTFDIDWAHDDVITDTIELLEKNNLHATWFITHNTSLIARLRDNPNFELGIHPNFNRLLNGDNRNGRDPFEVITRLMELIPEAKSIRSHSMLQSSDLLQLYSSVGLTHDVNHFIPASAKIILRPWTIWNGLTKVPFFWEDDLTCLERQSGTEPSNILEIGKDEIGLKVFDFHPIHVFLNTENMWRYEHTREIHQVPSSLINHRFQGDGTRSDLQNLIDSLS
jgi:hypothetical protein